MLAPSHNTYGSPAKVVRKSSPVHHQKSPSYAHMSNATPVQPTTKKVPEYQQLSTSGYSPSKQVDEAEILRHRVNQLETQLCQTRTDLELARLQESRAPQQQQDQGKVDLLLNQNSTLLQDNEGLQKNLAQKRTEVEIWKNKYETQMNSLIQLKANYEMEISKLQKDNDDQQHVISQINNNKNTEAQMLKQTIQEEGQDRIDFIKQTHAKNASLYEEQLRKMKDIIEDREKEIHELTLKLTNSRNASEIENLRINEDRERLRLKIQQLELQLSDELDNQKNQMDIQSNAQKQSMKKLHENEIEVLEAEAHKIRDLLEVKNDEIQALINQNRQQKQNYNGDIEELKAENANLQEKIAEINREKEEEINDLKEKLATLHITDIQEMKLRNESLAEHLTNENGKLKELIDAKSEELDNQIKEKLQQREAYNQELDRLKQEIEKARLQQLQTEQDGKNLQAQNEAHLLEVQNSHADHTRQLEEHIKFLEKELDALKQLLVKKNNDTDQHIARSNTVKNNLDEDNRILRKENDEWKQAFENLEFEKEKQAEEFRQKLNLQDQVSTDNKRRLEAKNDYLENELAKANEQIKVKTQDGINSQQLRNQMENDIRKLNGEIEQLREQLIFMEKLKAKELEEQRIKLENSNEVTVQTLKSSHQNQQRVMEQEIDNLKQIIEQKDREILDMIQKYETLEVAFGEFQQNSDKLQDYEKKLQMLGSEIVTTKNLYDVFVKTKSRFQRKQQQQ